MEQAHGGRAVRHRDLLERSASRSKTAYGLPVEFVIPQEGAIGWLDGLSVATGSANPQAAHQFIDYMVSPEFYVKWDTDVGAPASANGAANSQLPADAFKPHRARRSGHGRAPAFHDTAQRRAAPGVPGSLGRGQGAVHPVAGRRRHAAPQVACRREARRGEGPDNGRVRCMRSAPGHDVTPRHSPPAARAG